MRIKISADSTCDLPAELIKQHNIGVLPLHIIHGDESFRDGIDISPERVIEIAESGGGACSTSAVSLADYHAAFAEWRGEYDFVIHFTIGAGMSACYQNALLASADFSGVYVVDSGSLSSGIGLLALRAAELAAAEKAPEDIISAVEAQKHYIDASFVIESLDYIRRGGRCSAIAAFGANLLKLKPCIELKDGVMTVGKKYRGSFEKALLEYIADRLADSSDIDAAHVFLTHSPMDTALVNKVRAAVEAALPDCKLIESDASCTVTNHCGPNTLGVLFFRRV